MGRWSPARLAKTGFVIFVPLEVARLVSGGTFLGPWTTGFTWLGQALIIAATVWAALAWPGWTRLVRALLGLLFLMVPVWPWFTLYVWDAGAMPTEALLKGVDPAPFEPRAEPRGVGRVGRVGRGRVPRVAEFGEDRLAIRLELLRVAQHDLRLAEAAEQLHRPLGDRLVAVVLEGM